MKLSRVTRALLAERLEIEEGREARMYRDTRGIETIGVGFNLRANALPENVIDLLLEHTIDSAVADLDAIESRWVQLDQDRKLVLLEMAANLGRDRLRSFRRMWAAIRDFLDGRGAPFLSVAADEILDSDAARQLPARYGSLAERMRGGLRSTP